MANHIFSIIASAESDRTFLSINPNTSSVSAKQIIEGDTVQFNYSEPNGYGAQVSISGFATANWTSTANVTLSSGGSGTKASKTGQSTPVTIALGVGVSGGGIVPASKTIYIQIVSSTDAVPDQFDLGSNLSGVRPSAEYLSNEFTVSGLNAGASASVSGSGSPVLIVNNIARSSPHTVYAGDDVLVRMTSAGTYNTTVTATLNIGGVTDSWSLTTTLDPGSGEVIPFPITALPIKLSDVLNFFGGFAYEGSVDRPNNMGAYLKGGLYVPNISANAAIPTTLPLKLSDFIGSATAFFLSAVPSYKSANANTLDAPIAASVIWTVGTDFDVGFGPRMRYASEFRYTLTEYTTDNLLTGVTLNSSIGSPGTYSVNNFSVGVSVTMPRNSDGIYRGHVDFYIRSAYDPSKVITTRAYYRLNFFGP